MGALNGLHINLVVVHMGANKADVDNPVGVIDPHDKLILVPCSIEHYTIVIKDAGIPEVLLYLGMQGMTVPGQCWLLSILVVRLLFPELS